MFHEARFLEALKGSGVSKVAIIDDVFDAPNVTADNSGQILDFLEGEVVKTHREELAISDEALKAAADAIAQSEFSNEQLVACVSAFYLKFLKTDDQQFDPSGVFAAIKGPNLENTRPVIRLLEKATDVEVTWIGSNVDEIEGVGEETHLIFVDFYLDGELSANAEPKGAQRKTARDMALDRIRRLIAKQQGKAPSVVLMSSHNVRPKAEAFRAEIGKDKTEVFASRFSFIEKTHLKIVDGGEVEFQGEAADALLDIVQTFEFGRALNEGLEAWLSSALAGVEAVRSDISTLNLKELAYLVRFRLAADGENLLTYLEWFFGERLLDQICKSADAAAAGGGPPDFGDAVSTKVEGALDGPTKKIAELYHGVRVQSPRTGRLRVQRLGDLYLAKDRKNIFAVLTPDCDLIPRRPKNIPRVTDVLLVTGRVARFDAPETSVSDFIVIDNAPHNVTWSRKLLSTRPWIDLPAEGANDELEYIGTLRPLYAQELQRTVLDDLGRVGVSVAPAIAMSAAVKVTFKTKAGETKVVSDLSKQQKAVAYLFPSRGGQDKPRAVFRRQFVMDLLANLRSLSVDDLPTQAKGNFEALGKPDAYVRLKKLFGEGIALEEPVDLGIFVTGRPTFKSSAEGPWCWLTISMAESLTQPD